MLKEHKYYFTKLTQIGNTDTVYKQTVEAYFFNKIIYILS